MLLGWAWVRWYSWASLECLWCCLCARSSQFAWSTLVSSGKWIRNNQVFGCRPVFLVVEYYIVQQEQLHRKDGKTNMPSGWSCWRFLPAFIFRWHSSFLFFLSKLYSVACPVDGGSFFLFSFCQFFSWVSWSSIQSSRSQHSLAGSSFCSGWPFLHFLLIRFLSLAFITFPTTQATHTVLF